MNREIFVVAENQYNEPIPWDIGRHLYLKRNPDHSFTVFIYNGGHPIATLWPDGRIELVFQCSSWLPGQPSFKNALEAFSGFKLYSRKGVWWLYHRWERITRYRPGILVNGQFVEAWERVRRAPAKGAPSQYVRKWEIDPASKVPFETQYCKHCDVCEADIEPHGQVEDFFTSNPQYKFRNVYRFYHVRIKRYRKPGAGHFTFNGCVKCVREKGLVW